MASNLNKAFMRAYAKDRSASADDAPSTTVTSTAASAPNMTHPNAPRVSPTVEPAMEPTVYAGRYAPPQSPTAYTTAAQPQAQVMHPASVANTAKPSHTVNTANPLLSAGTMSVSSVPQPVATRVPTRPSAPKQPASASSQPVHSQTNIPQARVISGSPRPAVAQPTSTRIEQVQMSDSGDPTRVWQRIDEAHGAQSVHPTETQARPTVSVGAARTVAPKRQAAAVAPAPSPTAPAPKVRVDAPLPPNTRFLPLVGDEASPQPEPQQAESRRRTVADFLYSAGQYNPGRVLASADNVDGAVSATTSASAPTASMRTSESVRTMDRHIDESTLHDQAMSSHALNQQSVAVQTHSPATSPSHSYAEPMIDESMPRRMGQILRVDVPRNHTGVSTQQNAQQVAAQQAALQHAAIVNRSAKPVVEQPAMPANSPAMPAASVDAPIAKYVLEQRRMDRAHKLNEVEEKLRNDTHKIFNPVWEVDNLQWPAVVDKLMQQRAQSMSHVAEHLKTACQDGLSVLGVTSAHQGEGRTTVACCLARLAAAHGLNVALVDIDLDHPTLCVQTNMEVEHDWRDCLSEDVSLEEVAVHSINDQLTVLPLKARGGRPGLLASDSRIADILNDLAECFELVIVDCSKTNSSGNIITGLAHTKIFDAAIVVVDRRDGQADRVEDAVRMIQQTGIESIGIVDNFSM